jgi:hypothetical protein
MKQLQRMLWSLLAVAGTMGLVIATRPVLAGNVIVHIDVGTPPPPTPVVYEYVYYPEAQVYFVPTTRVYWWYAGGTWVSGPAVPRGIVLRSRTILRVDAPEPWRHHEVIIQKFPGRGKDKHVKERERDHDRDGH